MALICKPGPATAEERFEWPNFVIEQLVGGLEDVRPPTVTGLEDTLARQLRHNFLRNISGIRKVGHYDGYDSPGMALEALIRECKMKGWDIEDARNLHAAEKAGHPRNVLMRYPVQSRAAHIFGEINTRLPAWLNDSLAILRPAKDASDEVKATAYKTMGTLFASFYSDCNFDPSLTAHCYRHNRQCKVFEALVDSGAVLKDGLRPLRLAVAGHSCFDHSPIGSGNKACGTSNEPLLHWLEERKRFREDLIITECAYEFWDGATEFPKEYEALADLYYIKPFHLHPLYFGDPMNRPRMWCAMALKETCQFKDIFTLENLLKTLGRTCQLALPALFRAPRAAVRKMQVEMATDACLPPDSSFRCSLDGTLRGRLDGYEKVAQGMLEDGTLALQDYVCYDLDQNPDGRLRISVNKLMGLITHGVIWLDWQQRPAHVKEVMEAMGVCMWPEKQTTFSCPFSDLSKLVVGERQKCKSAK